MRRAMLWWRLTSQGEWACMEPAGEPGALFRHINRRALQL